MTLYSDSVIADSPEAYYRLNESDSDLQYIDSSVNAADISSIITAASVVKGRHSLAANARRSADPLTVPRSFSAISGFTFETWFKSSSPGTYVLAESYSNSTDIEVLVNVSPDPSDPTELLLKFGLGIGAWSIDADSAHRHAFVYSDPIANTLFDGEWHHIVCSWSGTEGVPWHGDQLRIYVDGVQRDDAATRSDFADALTIAPLTVEGQLKVAGPFTGSNTQAADYSDLAVYSHGLSEPQIIKHFNSGSLLETTSELEIAPSLIPATNNTLETVVEDNSTGSVSVSIGTLTFEAFSSVTVASQTLDMLSARDNLGVSGSISVDLSGATLEPGEPNFAGYNRTVWFELPVNPDSVERMRIILSSPTSSGSVTVYKQPSLDEFEDFEDLDEEEQVGQDPLASEPSLSKLVRVQGHSSDQVFTLDPEYGSSYFLQVGMRPTDGIGDDFVLTWGDASPNEGGSFDYPVEAEYVAGSTVINTSNAWLETGEPNSAGITETRSVWLRWTAPDVLDGPTLFDIESGTPGGPFAVGIFTGSLVNGLSQVDNRLSLDGLPVEITITATPGTTYYIRVASVDDGMDYSITWAAPKKDYPPAEPITQLRVTVHAGVAGITVGGRTYAANEMITELPNRMGAQFQERLNVAGSGSITVMQNDIMIRAFGPADWPRKDSDSWDSTTQSTWTKDPFQLLQMGNIVKFWMFNSTKGESGQDDCVSAFLIKSREIALVGTGEDADRMITVSGPTVHQLLNDFVVMPDNWPEVSNAETRAFHWASIFGAGDGWSSDGWFDATGNHLSNRLAWNHPINHSKFTQPPGWRKKRNQPYKQRPKYALVKRKKKPWPDRGARWMWMTANRNYNMDKTFPRKGYSHKGKHYYRAKSFNITHDGALYRFAIYSDTYYQVWLDGQVIITGNGNEVYNKYKVVTKSLRKTIPGRREHTLAVYVEDRLDEGKDFDHNDAFLMTVQRLNAKRKVVSTVIQSGGTGKWFAWHGDNPPSWSRAMILATVIREAKRRGNHSALALNVRSTFGRVSEDGSAWFDTKKYGTNIEVGTSALSLQEKFSESNNFDVWVDPDTLSIKAWQGRSKSDYPRGNNKTQNVALVPGHNLINYTVSETDDMKNRLLIKYGKGNVYAASDSATYANKYGHREGFVELGDVNDPVAARDRGRSLLSWLSSPSTSGGSEDVVGHINEEYNGSIIPVRGSVPFLDFNVGDVISAPGSNGILHGYRVMGLTCTEDAEGNLTFDPELQGA